MNRKIEPGTRVAYSVQFLRNFSLFTGYFPFARGIVVATWDEGPSAVAEVKWDEGLAYKVAISNLVREDQLHLEDR